MDGTQCVWMTFLGIHLNYLILDHTYQSQDRYCKKPIHLSPRRGNLLGFVCST